LIPATEIQRDRFRQSVEVKDRFDSANSILKFPRKISKDFSRPNPFHAFVIASVVPQSSAPLLPPSPPVV